MFSPILTIINVSQYNIGAIFNNRTFHTRFCVGTHFVFICALAENSWANGSFACKLTSKSQIVHSSMNHKLLYFSSYIWIYEKSYTLKPAIIYFNIYICFFFFKFNIVQQMTHILNIGRLQDKLWQRNKMAWHECDCVIMSLDENRNRNNNRLLVVLFFFKKKNVFVSHNSIGKYLRTRKIKKKLYAHTQAQAHEQTIKNKRTKWIVCNTLYCVYRTYRQMHDSEKLTKWILKRNMNTP